MTDDRKDNVDDIKVAVEQRDTVDPGRKRPKHQTVILNSFQDLSLAVVLRKGKIVVKRPPGNN
jgi:hypothetical protein